MLVILWIAGGLVAVVASAMLLLPLFVDEQALLDMAQAQVKDQTGGELLNPEAPRPSPGMSAGECGRVP